MDNAVKVTVFGDVMLDTYQSVTPLRVSAEAPVLICRRNDVTYSLGGAANVAANLKVGFGIDVDLISVTGSDDAGCTIIDCMKEYGISSDWMTCDGDWVTIEKLRFIDPLGRQVGFRLDTEGELPVLSPVVRTYLEETLLTACKETDVLVVSDYEKGVCTPELVTYAISMFRNREKYVVVNGKPGNFDAYKNANLVVFNHVEAKKAWSQYGYETDLYDADNVELLSALLYTRINDGKNPKDWLTDILITCGDQGMVWYNGEEAYHQEAIPVRVADVAGAGDTVVATIGAHGYCDKDVLHAAAVNAAEVVSQHGTSICAGCGVM